MSSSAEELSLELSGSGSIVDGVVAKGSSSASGSSSSGVGVIRRPSPSAHSQGSCPRVARELPNLCHGNRSPWKWVLQKMLWFFPRVSLES